MSTFQRGELILSCKPYAYVLNDTCRGRRCDNCFKKKTDLKQCSQCSLLYFCDRKCQLDAWKIHKTECKLLLKARPNVPTDFERLFALILLKIKKNGYAQPTENVFGRVVSFQTLMSHAKEINENPTSLQRILPYIETLKDYIGENNIPLPSDFIEIYGKVSCNTFGICDDEMQSIGNGLYLGASVFDHSCEPNAGFVFDSITMMVRALENLPHRDINQIYVSYIEPLQLTKDRQKILRERYYFTCHCNRCTSPHYEDLMQKLLVNEKEVTKQLNNFNQQLDHFEEMLKDKVEPVTIYKACMQDLALQNEVLADTHICKVKTLEIAFDVCVQSNQWADALSIGKQLLEPYRLYLGPYHPTLGLLLFRLSKIQRVLNMSSFLDTFQEAQRVLRIAYGETHPMYKDLWNR